MNRLQCKYFILLLSIILLSTAISISQDLANFNKIIVEASSFNFRNDKVYNVDLDSIFPSNQEDFNWICDTNVKANWITFRNKVIDVCILKKLDSESLIKCLDTINNINKAIALIPIAAYQAHMDETLIWVISCKWEYLSDMGTINDGQQQCIEYGHIRQWAIETNEFSIIGYWTCD
jgi:hypothetical protein